MLDGVFALPTIGEHVTAEREQRPVMPVVEGLEGSLVAGPHERHEPVVGGESQQPLGAQAARPRGGEDGRSWRGGGFHCLIIGPTFGFGEGSRAMHPQTRA